MVTWLLKAEVKVQRFFLNNDLMFTNKLFYNFAIIILHISEVSIFIYIEQRFF